MHNKKYYLKAQLLLQVFHLDTIEEVYYKEGITFYEYKIVGTKGGRLHCYSVTIYPNAAGVTIKEVCDHNYLTNNKADFLNHVIDIGGFRRGTEIYTP